MNTTELVEQSKKQPLTALPEAFRPNRPEVMNRPDGGPQIQIADGIMLDCLVGKHNQARDLTTGIVSFRPDATLPYHIHSRGESITILEGELLFDVEGRRYRLGKMDNLTIPAGLPHQAINAFGAVVKAHVALASSTPDRTLVPNEFPITRMAQDAMGPKGKEHVVRFNFAKRYAAGPNTEFIDHLNSDLMPGIEMSGGYGLFHQGGRLPAHIHDFDESICIIKGKAICNVEGKRYEMSDCETALQPRGRVHYFINEALEPMTMLWVYAGPRPERIIIDEAWTAPDSKAWQQV
jgi:quercetin dioxygenase-like cupin family protein